MHRTCPCCMHIRLSRVQALCIFCARLMNARMRSDFTHAFRVRKKRPQLYEDAMIQMLQWRNELDKRKRNQ